MAQLPDNLTPPPQAPPGVKPTPLGPQSFEREYVTQHGAWPWQAAHVLSPLVEDSTLVITSEILAEASREPAVHKSVRIRIEGVLTDDIVFATGATEEEAGSEREYKLYQTIMQFAERIIAGLEEPFWDTLAQMMAGTYEQGHCIAETVWETRIDAPTKALQPSIKRKGAGPRNMLSRIFGLGAADETPTTPRKRGTTLLQRPQARRLPVAIKPKPIGSVLFVVDEYMNVLGFVPVWAQTQALNFEAAKVLSKDKFLVWAINKRDSDPRGTPEYLPVMKWVDLKGFVPKEYLHYLVQESVPIPVLNLPPGEQGWFYQVGPDGKMLLDENERPIPVSSVEAGQMTIREMRNGMGVVVPAEVKVTPYRSGGGNTSQVFPEALNTIDSQIYNSMLRQEAAHSNTNTSNKSQAEVVEGRLTDLFFWDKRGLAYMTLYDLIAPAVRMNFGEWALAYMPKLSFGDFEKRDWARDLEVLAKAYFYGFLDDTQRAELMAWMSLPKPGPSRFAVLAEADSDGEPVVPNSRRPDKQPGNKGRNDGNSTPKQEAQDPRAQLFEEISNAVKMAESRLHAVGGHGRRKGSFVGYLRGRFAGKGQRRAA